MNSPDPQTTTLRIELMQAAITAMAGVLPRGAAKRAAETIRKSLSQQFARTQLPDHVDECLAGCLAPLLAALDSPSTQPGGWTRRMIPVPPRICRSTPRTTARTSTSGRRAGHYALRPQTRAY